MLVSAELKIGPYKKVLLATPEGIYLDTAYEADTEAKYYKVFVFRGNGRLQVVNGSILTRKIESAQFDLVDRDSGEVLYEVR